MPDALDPTETYLHLGEGPEVTPVPCTPDFWPSIGERTDLHRGRLLTTFTFDDDWAVEEVHPVGDEVLLVVEGRSTFHLAEGEGAPVTSVEAGPGEVVVVPAGAWHTADVAEPTRLVVITWGEGTEHRPRSIA